MKRERPEEYERRKAEAYVIGAGNPNPAVVMFTTEVATMAVNELLNRMHGYRSEPASANLVRQFHRMTDFRPGARPSAGVRAGTGLVWLTTAAWAASAFSSAAQEAVDALATPCMTCCPAPTGRTVSLRDVTRRN